MNSQILNEQAPITVPKSMKIRVTQSKGAMIVAIGIGDSKAHILTNLDTKSAVWISRNQEFKGDGADELNDKVVDIKKYLVEVYKEKWLTGRVTADMLKTAYERDFGSAAIRLDSVEDLLSAKERLLNKLEDALLNNPMRAKNKLTELEEKISDINRRITVLNAKEEKAGSRLLVKKRRTTEQTFSRVVRHRIKVLFIIRKSRLNNFGLCPIDCRVTVNGIKANAFSTGIRTAPEQWDVKYKAVVGNEIATAKLKSIKEGLEGVYEEFRKRGRKPQPEEVIAHYFDHELDFDKKWSLEDLAEAKIKDLTRRGRTKATIMKYRHIYAMFQEAAPIKLVEDVKKSHIRDFQEYLRAKSFSKDYANKCVCAVYGLFELAIANEAITINPVKGVSLDWERKLNLVCLDEEELQALRTEQWTAKLQGVVDSFLFMCYTGLHIADYMKLKNENIKTYRGEKFIEYSRQKNEQPAVVPLGKDAKELIEKYGSVEALPRISAQKQNDYLKVIAAQIKTEKLLTNKVARKTFTDMSINNRGMSFEAVASMLGHATTKFVQVYGKVRHQRLMAEWN